ncbi:MAG: branched-chain amino acid ABC transporter permease [Blautia sp.]
MRKTKRWMRREYLFFVGIYLGLYLLNYLGVINNYLFQVIMLAGINMIVTLSLNLVNGVTGLFSIGHAGFMAIGAYIAAVISTTLLPVMGIDSKHFLSNFVLLIALIGGGMAAAVGGFLIARPTLKVRGDYLAIVTLGFGEIIRSVIRLVEYVGGPRGMINIPKITNFTWVFVVVLLTVYASRNFITSTYGRSCLAIRENEIAAEAMGTDARKYKTIAFTFSAFLAGIGGGLFAHLLMYISPDSFAYSKSTDLLVYLYSGEWGLSQEPWRCVYHDPFAGALAFLDDWRLVIYAVVLLYVIIWRPYGISGGREMRFQDPYLYRPGTFPVATVEEGFGPGRMR